MKAIKTNKTGTTVQAKSQPAQTKASVAAPTATATAVPSLVTREQVDSFVGYNSGRFPTTAYAKALAKLSEGHKSLTYPSHGFLVTKGPKGCLINPVHFNLDTGFYSRKSGEHTLVGNAKALADVDGLTATFLSSHELVAKVLKHPKVKLFKSRDTGEEVEVALYNSATDSYFIGVTFDSHGHLRVINLEPAAKYNRKPVQWTMLRDVNDGKLIKRLSAVK